MAKKQPPQKRQRPPTRHRTSAAAARARKRQKRKQLIVTGVAGLVVLAIIGAFVGLFAGGSKKASSTTTTSSASTSTLAPTTTVAALPSAAGKPCVAVKGPLPKGAPAVPVELGAPPKTLVKKDLKIGTGAVVTAKQTLSVDYIGVSCSTGKIFDSSYSRGTPASFPLSGVIPGWQQGIPGMKVGGERLLGIPPALGYGTAGSPPDIAPNETLWFVVHVLSAK